MERDLVDYLGEGGAAVTMLVDGIGDVEVQGTLEGNGLEVAKRALPQLQLSVQQGLTSVNRAERHDSRLLGATILQWLRWRARPCVFPYIGAGIMSQYLYIWTTWSISIAPNLSMVSTLIKTTVLGLNQCRDKPLRQQALVISLFTVYKIEMDVKIGSLF